MKSKLLFTTVIGLLTSGVSNAATYSIQPASLEAGKTTSFKILEDNKDVSKDYNVSYVDSDPTVAEMTITPFAGSFLFVPKIVGTGYQIRAIKKNDSNVIRNFTVSIIASAPSELAINGGNSQSGTIGQQLSDPLIVQVLDKMGNPVSGSTINWLITSGEGSLSSSSSVSNFNGLAQISLTPSKSGSIAVSATVSSNSAIKTSFVVTAKAPTVTASKLSFSQIPSKITNSSNFSVSVVVKNSSGATVTNASNSITVGLFKNSFCTIPVTGTLTGTKSGNASNGQIQFSGLGYNSPETVYIGASSSGLTPVCSKSIVSSCSSGFHSQNGSCVANLRSCDITNGAGSQFWSNGSWSSCSVTSCLSSFHIENGFCLSDTKSCNVQNGSGSQSWSNDQWGSCVVSSCDNGYSLNVSKNSCVVELAASIYKINSGFSHTCGIISDNSVVCWGANNFGSTSAPSGSFKAIAAGQYHNCGIKLDNSVVCWGNNGDGQSSPPSGSFKQVSSGSYHTCGIRSDDSVLCWGNNSAGQSSPPSGSFRQVNSGFYHTCGIRSDDAVVCWGNNSWGQGSPPSGSFKQVSSAFYHSCGIRSDDSVVCWGANWDGQSSAPSGAFKQISSSSTYVCGIKSDNSVSCWGNNGDGQSSPPSGSFKQVSSGSVHVCGIKSDNSVVCWGSNVSGQISSPSVTFSNP